MPLAWSSAAWNGAGSIVASTWPLRTIWPSVKFTALIWPVTREITETVASGVTVPSAATVIGTSPVVALAMPTVIDPARNREAPDCPLPPTHRVSRIATPMAMRDHHGDADQRAPRAHENQARRGRGRGDGTAGGWMVWLIRSPS